MGMETDITRLVHSLGSKEIDVLLKLYYNRDEVVKSFKGSDFEEDILHSLTDKNLINASIKSDESIISLTEEGLSVCGSVMFNKIDVNKEFFKQKIEILPERAIASLVKRVMWKDIVGKESGLIDQVTKPYALDESMWYERVLLKDERIGATLERFYNVLEDLDFIKNIDGERWCSPEVEIFLKEEYRYIMDLTWAEEDSLKYYFFFCVYAQDQKNLLNFSGDGEEYRSMFFEEDSSPPNYLFSSHQSDPRMLLSSLGVSENRIMCFLEEMQTKEIVSERYYPLSSFSFFSENDKIFVISDIKSYMGYITDKFLKPVVDSLLS
jgi:hypothetical protein